MHWFYPRADPRYISGSSLFVHPTFFFPRQRANCGTQLLCLSEDHLSILGPSMATRDQSGFSSHSASLKTSPGPEAVYTLQGGHRGTPSFSSWRQKSPTEREFNNGRMWKPIFCTSPSIRVSLLDQHRLQREPCHLWGETSSS